MDKTKICKECKGKKTVEEKTKLKVEIDKGAPNGDRYVKHGEGNEYPGLEAGDLVVIIKEKKHDIFKRKGGDLFMEKEITLLSALTGLDFILTHLDGRNVRILGEKNHIINNDQLYTVHNLGMPFHKKSYEHGNLIIQFKVIFPDHLDSKSIELLKSAIPGDKHDAHHDTHE